MTNLSNVFTVENIEVKTDKNDNKYKTITVLSAGVEEFVNPLTGEVQYAQGKQKRSAFNAWEESYLPSNKGNADFGYNLKEGQPVVGSLKTVNTAPYIIDGREVSTYTCFFPGETTITESMIKSRLKSQGLALAGESAPVIVDEIAASA